MLIDTHCHIADDFVEESLSYRYCVMSSDIYSFEKVESLYQKYPDKIIPAFGIHPWKITEFLELMRGFANINAKQEFSLNQAMDLAISTIEAKLIKYPSAVVGELGLDFYAKIPGSKITHSKEEQLILFDLQFQLSQKLQRPTSIHCVKSQGYLLDYFHNFASKFSASSPPVIMHSYGGSREMIKQLMKAHPNIYFSFSHIVNGRLDQAKLSKIIAAVPENRLLAESDVSQNADAELHRSVAMIAQARQMDVQVLMDLLISNQKQVFI